VKEAARLREPLIIDAEVVHLSAEGIPDFDALHSRTADDKAVALAFDLLLAGDDLRRQPLIERKKALKWVLRKSRGGIQYVEHTEGDGGEMFAAICRLGLEGIVPKRLTSVYKSGPAKTWIKVKNPKAPAATRAMDGTFLHIKRHFPMAQLQRSGGMELSGERPLIAHHGKWADRAAAGG